MRPNRFDCSAAVAAGDSISPESKKNTNSILPDLCRVSQKHCASTSILSELYEETLLFMQQSTDQGLQSVKYLQNLQQIRNIRTTFILFCLLKTTKTNGVTFRSKRGTLKRQLGLVENHGSSMESDPLHLRFHLESSLKSNDQ